MNRLSCVYITAMIFLLFGIALVIAGGVLSSDCDYSCSYSPFYSCTCETNVGYIVMIVFGVMAIIFSAGCFAAARRMRWNNYSGRHHHHHHPTMVQVQYPQTVSASQYPSGGNVVAYPGQQNPNPNPNLNYNYNNYQTQYGVGQPAAEYSYENNQQAGYPPSTSMAYPPNAPTGYSPNAPTDYPSKADYPLQPPNAPPPPYN